MAMPSRFGWVDFAEEDREQMLRVVDLFREQGTQDELGIGTVRDALADFFFPGTSTIQTRARYFLFVPWIYQELEDKKTPSVEVGLKARRSEVKLIYALLKAGETAGVIGQEAKEQLRRLPSSVYWSGLDSWGVRIFHGSQDQYHRYLDVFYRRREATILTNDGEPVGGNVRENWDRGIPKPPHGLLDEATLALNAKEAQYLLDHVAMLHPDSLLAKLLLADRHFQCDHLWLHPTTTSLAARLKEPIRHARNFSEAIHGSALLYNLLMARAKHVLEWIEAYENRLAKWAASIQQRWQELAGWHQDMKAFWSLSAITAASIPYTTRLFVDQWLGILFAEGSDRIPGSAAAHRLIVQREEQLKHTRARLSNNRALELWNGASGDRQLDFRWRNASTLLNDIHAGLGHGGEHA
jgi:hypothetical protein